MNGTYEKIKHETGNEEAWICICNNTPSADGFYPCDEPGNEIEPTITNGWSGLYVCASCERIIDQETLDVVGRKQPKRTANYSL